MPVIVGRRSGLVVEWLKNALGTVYSKDGLLGIAVVVALILGALVTFEWLSVDLGGVLKFLGG
jgi:hypothetical protein